ncbi:hypothetical protein R3P38DRAFT_618517 [Favolaschia claudopus]|uniref:Uncharacterized protein n=1 Tax=Favolaschia claudopus TaxID=2862362 RepID=A0AAW0CBA9_9AGAR
MDPQLTALLNAESLTQIQARVQKYRKYNVNFLEYFAGSCRELGSDDALNFSLLATTSFPGVDPAGVQHMMNTIRYFLFDLQNSRRELIPHHGPEQTVSNLVFYRPYPNGTYGIVFPVQVCPQGHFQLPTTLRDTLATTPTADELQLLQNFLQSGNAYYFDELINRVFWNFKREVGKAETQARFQAPPVRPHFVPVVGHVRRTSTSRQHWSMVP